MNAFTPAGIYRTGSHVKVHPAYVSPNHNWLIFARTNGGYLIENNRTGRAQTVAWTPMGLFYENPYAIPGYVREALRKIARSI